MLPDQPSMFKHTVDIALRWHDRPNAVKKLPAALSYPCRVVLRSRGNLENLMYKVLRTPYSIFLSMDLALTPLQQRLEYGASVTCSSTLQTSSMILEPIVRGYQNKN